MENNNIKEKDITIVLPIHKFVEEDGDGKLLSKAVANVKKCGKAYKYGKLKLIVVCPEFVKPEVEKIIVKKKFDADYRIVVNDTGKTDFCSQVNVAVDSVETELFSILEYDDEYKENWFNFVRRYEYGNEMMSAFLPINLLHTNGNGWHLGNEFGLSNSFITDDADDNDEIGVINHKRLENCSIFNLTGAVINTHDFIKVGKYKPSVEIAFNYELLLRMTHRGLKCMVVPREGYVHELDRAGSLMSAYRETPASEINAWFELALREFPFAEDRGKGIALDNEEELS